MFKNHKTLYHTYPKYGSLIHINLSIFTSLIYIFPAIHYDISCIYRRYLIFIRSILNRKGRKNMAATNPIITFEMETGGIIKVELYPEIAPNTVKNFISLVQKKYYDGLIFHRVIKGFMIQGGDPEGTGMGGPGYSIKGEFKLNGFENDLRHSAGVISMARSQMPNSAGSQFFIMHKDSPHLDGSYAAFGKVVEGMDVVNEIADTQTDYSDRPTYDQKIKQVTVELFGETYEEPETL